MVVFLTLVSASLAAHLSVSSGGAVQWNLYDVSDPRTTAYSVLVDIGPFVVAYSPPSYIRIAFFRSSWLFGTVYSMLVAFRTAWSPFITVPKRLHCSKTIQIAMIQKSPQSPTQIPICSLGCNTSKFLWFLHPRGVTHTVQIVQSKGRNRQIVTIIVTCIDNGKLKQPWVDDQRRPQRYRRRVNGGHGYRLIKDAGIRAMLTWSVCYFSLGSVPVLNQQTCQISPVATIPMLAIFLAHVPIEFPNAAAVNNYDHIPTSLASTHAHWLSTSLYSPHYCDSLARICYLM